MDTEAPKHVLSDLGNQVRRIRCLLASHCPDLQTYLRYFSIKPHQVKLLIVARSPSLCMQTEQKSWLPTTSFTPWRARALGFAAFARGMAAVEQSDAKVDQMAVELVDGAVSDAVEKLELEALDDEPTAKALKIAGVAGLLLHRHCMPPSTSCGGIPPPTHWHRFNGSIPAQARCWPPLT
jgi:hypothetical protein